MNEIPTQVKLLRNLKDAGCDEAMIQKYLELQKEGKKQEQVRLLSLHRASLLDRVHVSQNMIDCLDYLLYSMKKKFVLLLPTRSFIPNIALSND